MAEVEFDTEDKMNTFVVPFSDWKDVSLESKYSGGILATNSKIESSEAIKLVKQFWSLFSNQKWDEASTLLHGDFVMNSRLIVFVYNDCGKINILYHKALLKMSRNKIGKSRRD